MVSLVLSWLKQWQQPKQIYYQMSIPCVTWILLRSCWMRFCACTFISILSWEQFLSSLSLVSVMRWVESSLYSRVSGTGTWFMSTSTTKYIIYTSLLFKTLSKRAFWSDARISIIFISNVTDFFSCFVTLISQNIYNLKK